MTAPQPTTPIFVFVDTETTGLNTGNDLLLEVGLAVTNQHLQILDKTSVVIYQSPLSMEPVVEKIHTDNGLIAAVKKSPFNLLEAERFLTDWVEAFFDRDELLSTPLCGSTVEFDRKFLEQSMPGFHSLFHYRSIDVSSIKELSRVWKPELVELVDGLPLLKAHRAEEDVVETIQELEHYRINWLV